MPRKEAIEVDLSKGKIWTNRNFSADLRAEKLKAYSEDVRQTNVLNTKVWPEDFDGRAFNLDLTRDELAEKMHSDPDYFPKYILATELCIPWEQAEVLFEHQLARKQKLTDQISRYHNSGRSRWRQSPNKPVLFRGEEPGKPSDYENPHTRKKKSKSKETWKEKLMRKAQQRANRERVEGAFMLADRRSLADQEENPFDKDT